MGRDRRKWITWIFVIATISIVALMMISTLRRTERITLPTMEETSGVVRDEVSGSDGLTLIEVTPQTVQVAVATLARPEAYRRTVIVEQFWNGGSAAEESAIAVSDGWSRIDRTLPNGQTRHAITNGEVTHIWYDQEENVRTVSAGGISADDEQAIPTYEDVLKLEQDVIAVADYRLESERQCIYVETAEDADGYVRRFWIDLDSGLLAMAETLQHGEIVYRMGATREEPIADAAMYFTLPDGMFLLGD